MFTRCLIFIIVKKYNSFKLKLNYFLFILRQTFISIFFFFIMVSNFGSYKLAWIIVFIDIGY